MVVHGPYRRTIAELPDGGPRTKSHGTGRSPWAGGQGGYSNLTSTVPSNETAPAAVDAGGVVGGGVVGGGVVGGGCVVGGGGVVGGGFFVDGGGLVADFLVDGGGALTEAFAEVGTEPPAVTVTVTAGAGAGAGVEPFTFGARASDLLDPVAPGVAVCVGAAAWLEL